jgi:hypothetical protein
LPALFEGQRAAVRVGEARFERWRIRCPLPHTGAAMHTDLTIGPVVSNATDEVAPEG